MRKASLSSCLTLLFAAPKRVQSPYLVLLLSQTRTLLSEPKTARYSHAANRCVYSHDRCRRNFCSTPQGKAYTAKERRLNSDPIAFVDPYHKHGPETPSDSRYQRPKKRSKKSTVTAPEQAAFNRLIKEVSHPASPEPDDEDILDEDELITGYDPGIDLDSIFEDAIKQLRMQREEAEQSAVRNLLFGPVRARAIDTMYPNRQPILNARTFKRPLKLANGTLLGDEVTTEEESARLEVACDDHRSLVMDMLDGAKSDVEIWQILDKEVFSLITLLDEHIKIVEKAQTLREAKVRKAEAEGKDIEDVKLEKGDLNKREVTSAKLTRTKAIPINNLLSILHRNYAEYCLHALRLFRRNHPHSLYALQVLTTIKRRGAISYVLGVSTDIYNEVLFLQWTQFSDLQGVADTVDEMLNQGIEGNEATVALIRGIGRQRRMGQREFLGTVVKEWGAMRGRVEGWTRLVGVYERTMSEMEEKAALIAAEVDGKDEESDGESAAGDEQR